MHRARIVRSFLASTQKYALANSGAERGMPSSPSTRSDDLPNQGSANENQALDSTSAGPQLSLEDDLWGDLGLGITDSWDLSIPSMTWTA
jgi:hypothetical protein